MPGLTSTASLHWRRRVRAMWSRGAARCTACRSASRTSSIPMTCRRPMARSVFKSYRPTADSGVVALLRRAGLVILGKCATTEFASPIPAGVRNPHDLRRSPGVSSSGSAAAVADHMTPLCRRLADRRLHHPARLPSVALSASRPVLPGSIGVAIRHLRPTLDTIGLFARHIDDIALLNAVLTGCAPAVPPKRCRRSSRGSMPHPQLAPRPAGDSRGPGVGGEVARGRRRLHRGCRDAAGVRRDRELVPGHLVGGNRAHHGARRCATILRRMNHWLQETAARRRGVDQAHLREGTGSCDRMSARARGSFRTLRRDRHAERLRRGDRRSHRRVEFRVQPHLDIDARSLRQHPGLHRAARDAGRDPNRWAPGGPMRVPLRCRSWSQKPFAMMQLKESALRSRPRRSRDA